MLSSKIVRYSRSHRRASFWAKAVKLLLFISPEESTKCNERQILGRIDSFGLEEKPAAENVDILLRARSARHEAERFESFLPFLTLFLSASIYIANLDSVWQGFVRFSKRAKSLH